LGDFLNKQFNYWSNQQEMVEKRFIDLTEAQQKKPPEPKRKRKIKIVKSPNVFAEYAAELQVEFFVEVSTNICYILKLYMT
jgi:hypothetical protein